MGGKSIITTSVRAGVSPTMRHTMAEDRTEDIQQLMRETARVQLATLNAAIAFWSGWVGTASKFAIAANQELLKISEGGEGSNEVAGRLTDLSREFLRELAELPNQAVSQFNSEVQRESTQNPHRVRA